MKLFFDTSALVKFFYIENGTEKVTELITDINNELWLFELAKTEFYSSLYRKYRNNELSNIELNIAQNGFEEELIRFNIEIVNSIIFKESEYLIKTYGKEFGLRTLDSLHLAAFSIIADDDWYFVTADDVLCNIVDKLGFKYIKP